MFSLFIGYFSSRFEVWRFILISSMQGEIWRTTPQALFEAPELGCKGEQQ